MHLDKVLGQEKIKRIFCGAVRDNRVAHAYLLAGPSGYGGLALSLAFGAYLSCSDRNENEICGRCPSCLKYGNLAHPDLHFIFPVNKGQKEIKDPVSDDYIDKWRELAGNNPYFDENRWYNHIGLDNQQGIITKAESENLIRRLSLKTFESDWKVIVIWLPEKMNHVAANKLLKTLEEPYLRTVFFLVCESPEQLLPTVLSRVQVLRLEPIDDDLIRASLRTEFDLPEEKIHELVRLARGNYQEARMMAEENEEITQFLELFKSMMRNAYGSRIQEIQDWVGVMTSLGREKQKSFLKYSLRMVRENMLISLVPGEHMPVTCLSEAEADFNIKFSRFIHQGNAEDISGQLALAHRHIEANGFARIVFTDLSLKLVDLIRQ